MFHAQQAAERRDPDNCSSRISSAGSQVAMVVVMVPGDE